MPNRENGSKQRIWAVGGGKGGVGKSLVATNLAVILATLGKKVIAADLDLGNANMHTCLGIRYPQKTLLDFLNGNVEDLQEIILDTSIYNLKMISGSAGVNGSANPHYTQKLKLLRYLDKLLVDEIVLDLGAGTSYNTIDFFLGASNHLIISTPETTSIQSAYNFIRICLFRKLHAIFSKNDNAWSIVEKSKIPTTGGMIFKMNDLLESIEEYAPESVEEFRIFQKSFRPFLIMNMVLKNEEAKLGWGLSAVVRKYLGIDMVYCGSLTFDKVIRESLITEIPYIINAPGSRPSEEFVSFMPKLLEEKSSRVDLKDMIMREIRRTNLVYRDRIIQARKMDVDPSIYVADKLKEIEVQEQKEPPSFFNFKSGSWSKIAIDIGSSSTVIYVKGRGIVLNEPSLMSIDENTGKVVTVGYESKAMLGRVHSGIKIVAPLETGTISDYSQVKTMISEFIKRAKSSTILIRPNVLMTIPLGMTGTEKQAVKEFIKDLGARETHIVYESFAAAVGAGLPIDVPKANMLVNIGAGNTSALVLSLGGIVSQSSKRIGSRNIDNAIIKYLREEQNFRIGEQTAEWVKMNFAQAVKLGRDKKFQIRGQDLNAHVPRSIMISTAEIRECISKPVKDIVDVIMELLEQVPPELSSDLLERGMILTGGGSYLRGLDIYISELTGIKVRVASNALTATVEGAGRMLDDFKKFSRFFLENEIEPIPAPVT